MSSSVCCDVLSMEGEEALVEAVEAGRADVINALFEEHGDSIDINRINTVDIPNVITPNGDGVNDALVIPGIENYPDHELIIYNQWGDVVYQTRGYKNDWVGTYNGEPLPDGTYFYIFKENRNQAGPYTRGFITIIR